MASACGSVYAWGVTGRPARRRADADDGRPDGGPRRTPRAGADGALAGQRWFGWSRSEQTEKLRADWVRATDPGKRKRLAAGLQKLASDEVPYVPWGQWALPSAHRRSVRGVLQLLLGLT